MKPQITASRQGVDAGAIRLQKSCGMKPQITISIEGDVMRAEFASKELRHEAADHRADHDDQEGHCRASKELRHEAADHIALKDSAPGEFPLQKSCGMKPQITAQKMRDDLVSLALQKSCGMKPQITLLGSTVQVWLESGFKRAAA